MSSAPTPTASPSPGGVLGGLDHGGSGQNSQGQSTGAFLSAIIASFAIFGVQVGLFLLIHGRIARIYQPRTYLVPERERTKPPPKGILDWIRPVFYTTNAEFIQKCGLDAYFFLRYLRTLLKIFLPLAFVTLPILLPINAAYGRGPAFATGVYDSKEYLNVTGLDRLAWGNVRPTKNGRYWAHFFMALVVIIYTCYVLFDELRSYIRLRQAYLTSPQHRLRASATTVLVTAIPTKWCTFEALDGLYDVYPGGIRNIWINRNFDDLNNKVKWRNRLASALESAETNLIKKVKKIHARKVKADAKKAGKKSSKSDELAAANESGLAMAQTDGINSGDPHQTRHTIDDALDDSPSGPTRDQSLSRDKRLNPIPVLGQGIEVVGHGLDAIGKTVFGGFKKATKDVDGTLNTTGGFVPPTPETTTDRGRAKGNVRHDTDISRTHSLSPETEHRHGAHDASQRGRLQPDRREVSDGSTVRQSSSQDEDTHSQQQRRRDPSQQGLAIDGAPTDPTMDDDGLADDILHNPERIGEAVEGNRASRLKFWKRTSVVPYGIPSPTPHGQEEDEFPLSRPSPMTPGCNPQATINGKGLQKSEATDGSSKRIKKKDAKDEKKEKEYPTAIEAFDPTKGDPKWMAYMKEKDRETMRLPIFGWKWHWMPSLPLLGKKVDAINYCRKEVARLNLEIEEDQKDPEKYPLMNSAFVQFNHQVAAHMACQAVSHHTPSQMAPRLVEISPDDVIWDNMSIKWWESYLRVGIVLGIIAILIVFWAIPVSFTGLLANLDSLQSIKGLQWIARIPSPVKAIIQGIVPQLLLAALLAILPLLMRLLAQQEGDHTGMAVELSVQTYYFAFLFVQVFLVVSISAGITTIIPQIINNPISIPSLLAANLPKASNYFFSYMLLQALSVSSGALVQVSGLLSWYVIAPLLDSTARQKWKRQVTLPNVHWGSFFPVYSNLACIGLIYSVISPLMMIFNIITFSLFWLVYRYNTLYVTKFRFDTGGLLYPRAIKQLFVGLYVMELVLIGLFFLVRDSKLMNGKEVPDGSSSPCKAQAIMMIVVFGLTVIYQYLLSGAFGPLIKYLPITLEDEAVMRDEQFARAQEKRWMLEENGHEDEGIESIAQVQARPSTNESRGDENIEMREMDTRRDYYALDPRNVGQKLGNLVPGKASWADRSRNKAYKSPVPAGNFILTPPQPHRRHHRHLKTPDLEGQPASTSVMGEAFFAGINDEIEDLTPDERDKLVQRAFQHEALRARRPVIWIPRDDLGVSDDEIERTRAYSKYVWINNGYTGLDGKGNVIYRKSPPDFSEVDLIEL